MSLPSFSIRTRLLATSILAIVFLGLLTGVNLYGQRGVATSLVQIQDKAFYPMLAIQELESLLKDIRYDTSSAVLDLTSFLGARQRLQEKRTRLQPAWGEFRQSFNPRSDEQVKLAQEIEQQMASINGFLDKLDAAYAKEDRDATNKLLQQKWPLVQKHLIRPLSELGPDVVLGVKDTLKETLRTRNIAAKRLNNLSIAAFLLCTIGLLLMVIPLTTSLNRAIVNLKQVLAKVAEGDLSAHPDISRKDELGDMARSLDQTLEQLRHIIGALKPSGDNLASCSELMSQTLLQVIKHGEQSTGFVNEAASSLERMTQTAEDIAQGASTATGAAEKARVRAADGNTIMESSLKATQRIEVAVTESTTIINELAMTSERINEITNTIREIADQTNLLALNAAIEAARAGEQGRGFAVVADEVRNLAERTSISTVDISSMVESIRSRMAQAVEAMTRVGEEVAASMRHTLETREAFEGIVEASSEVTQIAQQIAMATDAQLNAASGSTQNMEQVVNMSQESRSSLIHVEDISEQLIDISGQLRQIIGRFQLA